MELTRSLVSALLVLAETPVKSTLTTVNLLPARMEDRVVMESILSLATVLMATLEGFAI